MRLANDALSVAKDKGRNRAEITPSLGPADLEIYVKTKVTAEKVEAEAKKIADQKTPSGKPVSKDRDSVTGFNTQTGARDAAHQAGNIERIMHYQSRIMGSRQENP